MISVRNPSSAAMISAWVAAFSAIDLTDLSVTWEKFSIFSVTKSCVYSTYASFVCGGATLRLPSEDAGEVRY